MEIIRSRNFPKDLAAKVLPRWKTYRETFGFESDLYKELKLAGLDEERIRTKLIERRKLISELWKINQK